MEDADITLRCDHLPLRKFLAKHTLNSKVNNWAIEISPFHITFKYIKGIKNTLANTMSRLIDIDLQVQPETEPEGYKFRCYTFDTLPTLEVSNVETSQNISLLVDYTEVSNDDLWKLPLSNDTLPKLQQKDIFCNNILNQIEKGNIIEGQLYAVKDKVLKRYVIDGNNTYETTTIPRVITAQILQMAHDNLGHNGTHRTDTLLKRLYYWSVINDKEGINK